MNVARSAGLGYLFCIPTILSTFRSAAAGLYSAVLYRECRGDGVASKAHLNSTVIGSPDTGFFKFNPTVTPPDRLHGDCHCVCGVEKHIISTTVCTSPCSAAGST
ncbi:hypothetical protein EDB92DRAFT_1886624, partial [Lactarius akahatsu]